MSPSDEQGRLETIETRHVVCVLTAVVPEIVVTVVVVDDWVDWEVTTSVEKSVSVGDGVQAMDGVESAASRRPRLWP